MCVCVQTSLVTQRYAHTYPPSSQAYINTHHTNSHIQNRSTVEQSGATVYRITNFFDQIVYSFIFFFIVFFFVSPFFLIDSYMCHGSICCYLSIYIYIYIKSLEHLFIGWWYIIPFMAIYIK